RARRREGNAGAERRLQRKVHAFVRVKPTANFPQDMIKYGPDNKSIDIYIRRDVKKGVINNKQTDWSFKLDGVLHNASQDSVYDAVARDLVSQALDGYNGNLLIDICVILRNTHLRIRSL
uniref:Kinesin motor domain-containing protein n=1 Tax=Chelonoidis abingdonii TaxID=106734 RepID=A0A8C0J9Y3_CHEAB